MAKYSIRDVFGRFAKLVGGSPEQRPPPLRDATGRYLSPRAVAPPPIPILEPRFIDLRSQREREFDELVEQSQTPDAFKPDINEYVYDYEREWLAIWDIAPVETMTDGQIRAMVDMILDIDLSDEPWHDIYEAMRDDFWEWFREHYGQH
jgi:hypothetical protein